MKLEVSGSMFVKNKKQRFGFTIIEMTLSMAFISLLMMAVGYLVIYLSNLYQRGISIKDVNKTADLIISDMQNSVSSSGEISCAWKEIDSVKMSVKKKTDEEGNTVDDTEATCGSLFSSDANTTNIVGGALCTGKYSYVWNYGYALDKSGRFNNRQDKLFRYAVLDSNGNRQIKPIRLAKIRDVSGAFCKDSTNLQGGSSPDDVKTVILSSVENNLSTNSDVFELIEASDRDIALHSFSVMSSVPDSATGEALYEAEFVLGTFREGLLMTNDAQCKNLSQNAASAESDKISEQDMSYCAINKFNFAVRAAKGKGEW